MARRLIVLALVFVAFVGLASAAPSPSTTDLPAQAPLGDDFIGTDDANSAGAPSADGSTIVAGPMGNAPLAAGPAGEKGDATTLKVSAIAGVASVVGYLFF